MEDLLYLGEVKKQIQIGLVSVLPEMYAKKLNLVHLDSSKKSLEYLLKTRGARQKNHRCIRWLKNSSPT